MRNKTFVTVVLLFVLLLSPLKLHADNNLLVQGLEAYRQQDWSTALFFLRKASTLPENLNAETWYVLIMSEIFAGDYESVETDGAYFMKTFPTSSYMANVEYQMARAWFNTGEYQKAIDSFGAFCVKYSDSSLIRLSIVTVVPKETRAVVTVVGSKICALPISSVRRAAVTLS